jgi:hypothetical protein
MVALFLIFPKPGDGKEVVTSHKTGSHFYKQAQKIILQYDHFRK